MKINEVQEDGIYVVAHWRTDTANWPNDVPFQAAFWKRSDGQWYGAKPNGAGFFTEPTPEQFVAQRGAEDPGKDHCVHTVPVGERLMLIAFIYSALLGLVAIVICRVSTVAVPRASPAIREGAAKRVTDKPMPRRAVPAGVWCGDPGALRPGALRGSKDDH